MNKTHELKTLPIYFNQLATGKKTFEVRKNDRDFQVGDTLVLKEWDVERLRCTGCALFYKISFILSDFHAIKKGYVVLGIQRLDKVVA